MKSTIMQLSMPMALLVSVATTGAMANEFSDMPSETVLKQTFCVETSNFQECAVSMEKAGVNKQQQPVYLVRATLKSKLYGDGPVFHYRAVISQGKISDPHLLLIREEDIPEITDSGKVGECTTTKRCLVAVRDFQGGELATDTGVFKFESQYNRFNSSTAVGLVPELHAVLREESWYSASTNPQTSDIDTESGGLGKIDYATGRIEGLTAEKDEQHCGPKGATGNLIPIDHSVSVTDWQAALPAQRLVVKSKNGYGLEMQNGWLIKSKPNDKIAESFWVTALDQDTLLLEVSDAHITTSNKNWVNNSHVEIWLWDPPVGYCSDNTRSKEALRQWGVSVTDGKIYRGYGKADPEQLQVNMHKTSANTIRLLVKLPAISQHAAASKRYLSVAYSVSDGKRQSRLLGTTYIHYGNPHSLGWIYDKDKNSWFEDWML